jgi:hypothetical protein
MSFSLTATFALKVKMECDLNGICCSVFEISQRGQRAAKNALTKGSSRRRGNHTALNAVRLRRWFCELLKPIRSYIGFVVKLLKTALAASAALIKLTS